MRDEPCFVGTSVTVGLFRCAPHDPAFEDSGPAEHHCFVFPRTSVWIRHAGQPAFVADPHIVTLYNPGQEYYRRAIDCRGDACEWFAVTPDVLRDVMAALEPSAADRDWCGFRDSHVLSDDRTYVEQRRVFQHVTSDDRPDAIFVEETVLRLLWRLMSSAGSVARASSPGNAQELSEATKSVLAASFKNRLTLRDIAGAVGTSAFHLCRAFRSATGTTIHSYLTRLRLRASLEPLLEGAAPITEIALAHGYSSHSHYTNAFRRGMGITPSDARRTARQGTTRARLVRRRSRRFQPI